MPASRSAVPPTVAYDGPAHVLVNDLHSRLNPTRVRRVVRPRSAAELPGIVAAARAAGLPICVAGGWHAMGGQQFAEGGLLVDTRDMAAVLGLDAERGLVEAEAGIMWPALIAWLRETQAGGARPWSIRQKQSGADRLTLGGAVAANAHGRGLAMTPFVGDVEALTVVGPDGVLRRCSRDEHAEMFRHVVGGYGLFGIVATVTLRLAPLVRLRRRVVELEVDGLLDAFAERIAAGHLYGDFQFAVDPASDRFLRRGILSAYGPADPGEPEPPTQHALSVEDWRDLSWLAHVDKGRAYDRYAEHYLRTDGQRYWSDLHQLATYEDDYHFALDERMGAACPATEMITELYVPRPALPDFLARARTALRTHDADVVYGTIRLIERDDETALAWAREPWACTILNLHVAHEAKALARAADAFRALIDAAAAFGGSYFLTYHRWATRAQALACHPRLPAFLAAKHRLDPELRFQSEWWRHHERLVGGG